MVKEFTFLSIFATHPSSSFSLQEFEDYFNTPHQTIKKYLAILTKKNILVEDKRKRFRFYHLNKNNPLTLDALSICEKLRLQKRLHEDTFLTVLYEKLSPHFSTSSFLLFGSATKEKEYNDIDLLCIGADKEVDKTIALFEKTFFKDIELIKTTPQNISEGLHKELIKKHIILNNHDYFTRFLFQKDSLV